MSIAPLNILVRASTDAVCSPQSIKAPDVGALMLWLRG